MTTSTIHARDIQPGDVIVPPSFPEMDIYFGIDADPIITVSRVDHRDDGSVWIAGQGSGRITTGRRSGQMHWYQWSRPLAGGTLVTIRASR